MPSLGMCVNWISCSISIRLVDHRYSTYVGVDADVLLQVYAILDEVFLAGEIEETSKQVVLTRLAHLDKLE